MTADWCARVVALWMLNSLWQDTAVLALVALFLSFQWKLNASSRYVIWFTALLACLVGPIVSTVGGLRQTHESHRVSLAPVTSRTSPGSQPILTRREEGPGPAVRLTPLHLSIAAATAYGALFVWISGAGLQIILLGTSFVRLRRLKRYALPLPIAKRDVARLARARGSRTIRFCTSADTDVPAAIGLFDSAVLIPEHLVDVLDADDLHRICLHEIRHLVRRDDWMNLFQRIIAIALWFNPVVYAILRHIDLEREVACDDDVVFKLGEPMSYAECLVTMADVTPWPCRSLVAPGAFVSRRAISERIERVLSETDHSSKSSILTWALSAGLLAVLIAAMSSAAPTIASEKEGQKAATSPETSPLAATRRPYFRPTPNVPPLAAAKAAAEPTLSIVAAQRNSAAPSMLPVRKVAARPIHRQANSKIATPIASAVPSALDVDSERIDVTKNEDPSCSNACDFDRVNWPGRDLAGRTFNASHFVGANLVSADFARSRLAVVNFSAADLRNADFTGAAMTYVNFQGATLDGATFAGASITVCDFRNASLKNVDLTTAHLGPLCKP